MEAKMKSAGNWAKNGPFNIEVKCIFYYPPPILFPIIVHRVELKKLPSILILFIFIFFSLNPFEILQHFISINLAAGSVKNFHSLNNTMLNGDAMEPKPWDDGG
jgi:hypothetical protein